MKNLILILSLGLLSACAGGGGGGSAPVVATNPHVVDNTPHDYAIKVVQIYAPDGAYTITLHQICNDGFAGFRDESAGINLTTGGTQGGIGCGAAKNVVLEAMNPYGYDFAIIVTIDGVDQPDVVLAPGQTFHFEAGF
jgi:hypothetical protein